MNELRSLATAGNRFSTRHVRPGAIPYLFNPGQSLAKLLDRLRQNGWRGQVVGPHGSGKSALLATLIPAIEQLGRHVLLVELHDGQRRLPIDLRRLAGFAPKTVVIVDGYEQLSRWNQFGLKRFCRRHGLGLVVTSHASVGLPDLLRTGTSLLLARRIIRELLEEEGSALAPDEVDRRFQASGGDMREMLFGLYDWYEQHRRRPPTEKGNRDSPGAAAGSPSSE